METILYCKSTTGSAGSQSRNSGTTSSNKSNSIGSTYSQEHSSLYIASCPFDGQNYLDWARSIELEIRGRGKFGYLTGDFSAPGKDDPKYPIWEAENAIVMVWLLNSMDPEISQMYLFCSTAKEIWDSAKKMFSDVGNASKILEIHFRLKEIQQGNQTVTKYFLDLQHLWQELDLHLEADRLCPDCSIKHNHQLEKERVFEFLIGLNNDLDEVRRRLVGRSPFPTIIEAFSEVRHEEARKGSKFSFGPCCPV